jgi:hypothetical protein
MLMFNFDLLRRMSVMAIKIHASEVDINSIYTMNMWMTNRILSLELFQIKIFWNCYRTVCSLGQRIKDRDQIGVTGTFPTQCHLNGEVLSV